MLDVNNFTEDKHGKMFYPFVKCYDSEYSYYNTLYILTKIDYNSRFSIKLFTNDTYTVYVESLGCIDSKI